MNAKCLVNHLGSGDLVRHVEDMVDNLLTNVQILAPLSPCGGGGLSAVTPGHEQSLMFAADD